MQNPSVPRGSNSVSSPEAAGRSSFARGYHFHVKHIPLAQPRKPADGILSLIIHRQFTLDRRGIFTGISAAVARDSRSSR